MEPILLADRVDQVEASGRCVAVVAPGRIAPAGMDVATIDAILERPSSWFNGKPLTMVLVGLSTILTPSNRARIGQVVLRPRPGVRRISVDDRLFNVDPWRMWWHFYAVGAERWGFTDSFLAETRWKAALELRTPCPFRKEAVMEACRGVVRSVRPFVFHPIEVEVVSTTAKTKAEYKHAKEAAFASEKTLPAILKRLARFAQSHVPSRVVPTAASFFKRPLTRIVRSDLAIDDFLVGQLLERADLTNAIAEATS